MHNRQKHIWNIESTIAWPKQWVSHKLNKAINVIICLSKNGICLGTCRRIYHWRNMSEDLYLQLSNASHVVITRTMCHAGTKSVRPFIAPSSEPHCVLTLIELFYPFFHSSNRGSRIDGTKLSIPSTSRTPAARCGPPSINLLAGLDAPLAYAPLPHVCKLYCLATHENGGTQEWKPRTNKELSDLWKVPTPQGNSISGPFSQRSFLLPSGDCIHENHQVWILFSRSLYSTLGQLSNLGFAITSRPACTNSKFQRSGEEH